jgi:hypothetical protein
MSHTRIGASPQILQHVTRSTVIVDLERSGQVKNKAMCSIRQRHLLKVMSPRAM